MLGICELALASNWNYCWLAKHVKQMSRWKIHIYRTKSIFQHKRTIVSFIWNQEQLASMPRNYRFSKFKAKHHWKELPQTIRTIVHGLYIMPSQTTVQFTGCRTYEQESSSISLRSLYPLVQCEKVSRNVSNLRWLSCIFCSWNLWRSFRPVPLSLVVVACA